MKKFNYFFAAVFLLFVSCVAKDKLPENPKDKQEYRDSQGNSWIWNAMLMRWALTPSGGGSPSYFYYPGNGSWTNSGGVKVDPPAGVRNVSYGSAKPNSVGSKAPASGSKSTSGKGFGSSFSSKPIGA